jgi:hypothetical protein
LLSSSCVACSGDLALTILRDFRRMLIPSSEVSFLITSASTGKQVMPHLQV